MNQIRDDLYGREFQQRILDGSVRSARAVLPELLRLYKPRSVVDFGCGAGAWLSVWRELGVTDVLGLDGAYVPLDSLMVPTINFTGTDLSHPVQLGRTFDLAMSLEVAEHLPASRAASFVADICRSADVVVFGAAIPGQGGTGHINCQWQSYWARLFEVEGFGAVDCLRPMFWSHANVMPWYFQNTLVYLRGHTTTTQQIDIAHPSTVDPLLTPPGLRATIFSLPKAFRNSLAFHGNRRVRQGNP